jgi:hypothetical protein
MRRTAQEAGLFHHHEALEAPIARVGRMAGGLEDGLDLLVRHRFVRQGPHHPARPDELKPGRVHGP